MAAQEMALSLERMPAVLLAGFNGEREQAAQVFQAQMARLEQQLDHQRDSVSSDRERELTGDLTRSFLSLRETGAALLVQPSRSIRRRDYDEVFYPNLLRMQVLLDELRRGGHQAILVTSESAARVVRRVSVLMAAGILLGLALSGVSVYRLARSILVPIQSLTRATRELAQGEGPAPMPVGGRDELAVLTADFNAMAAQLREYRQSTSAEILRLHRTMEATLASFPDPVYVLSPAGTIELQNPAAGALNTSLGLSEGLPSPLCSLVHGAQASGAPHLPNDFKDVICLQQDGQERFYLPRIMAMRHDNGTPIGVAAVLYDLTRFRLLDAVKSNLAATVSHELKTPLTGVRMALHLLHEESLGPLSPQQRDMVGTAREDAERLLRILNDLLDLARLEEGGSGLRKAPVDPGELCRLITAELADPLAASGLQLETAIPADLPRVLIDVQRIRHVFANLISNAIRHSPPGGRIVVRAEETPDHGVEFSVRDQGPGIPPELQQRVFERFFRIPGQGHGGAGLGLSIAREIVLAHGGYLGLRCSPGQGCEFYFSFPPPEPDDLPAARPPRTSHA
jgi:two-component system, NtrC family, sensor histidine kinase KinB